MSCASPVANHLQSSTRILIQQVVSAKLQLNHGSQHEEEEEFAEIGRGIVVFVCFLKNASPDVTTKLAKTICDVRLSYSETQAKLVSVADLPGEILLVPQATLGGKIKGKMMQYHNNIDKRKGEYLFQQLIDECISLAKQNNVRHGTYGNRQVLEMQTNGPYTHIIEL